MNNLSDLKKTNLSRVPQITILFWVVKILSTGMGEVFSDFLNYTLHINHDLMVYGGLAVMCLAAVLQFSRKKYIPWVYWLLVLIISVYGTVIADDIHEVLGVPYLYSATFFLILLAIILGLWQITQKSLSIHSITTWKKEAFYWATVLVTFALGTAAGDVTATVFDWGTLASGVIFTIIILIPCVGFYFLKFNEIFAFWFAYIITRPLGASYADWFSSPEKFGGIGIGSGLISLIMTCFIVGFVAYLQFKELKKPKIDL